MEPVVQIYNLTGGGATDIANNTPPSWKDKYELNKNVL